MKKAKLYLPSINYFKSDVYDNFNEDVKHYLFNSIELHTKQLKNIIRLDEKIKYLEDYAISLDKENDFTHYKNHFDYKINLDTKTCAIFETTLTVVFDFYLNEPIEEKTNEFISILDEEIFDVIYGLERFEIIYINDAQEFIDTFYRIKGRFLLYQTVKFIEYETLIQMRDKISSNFNLDIEKTKNIHPRIFINNYAFMVFERLKETIYNPLADYSFIYRKMIKDKLIFETIGDSEFRQWLSKTYQVEIDKTKQLHRCTTDKKEQLYSEIKDSIKQ